MILAVALGSLSTATPAFPEAGRLDRTFSSDGVSVIRNGLLGPEEGAVHRLAIQADGKVLVGGEGDGASAGCSGVGSLMARLDRDGHLDATFGSGGIVEDPKMDNLVAIGIQTDDKIVVTDGCTLARYNPNGTINTAFGSLGYVDILGPSGIVADALALSGNGEIVVGGDKGCQFALERFTTAGAPDGYFAKQFDSSSDQCSVATSLVVQPNGAVVAAGYAGYFEQAPSRVVVARIVGGGLDPTFGNNGARVTQLGKGTHRWSAAEVVALDAQGRIVVAGLGSHRDGGLPGLVLARYVPNGDNDLSFGKRGRKIFPYPFGRVFPYVALAVQTDADLVVAATGEVPGFGLRVWDTWSAVTARYLPGGELDLGYGRCGVTANQFDPIAKDDGPVSRVNGGMRINDRGRIYIAGDLYPRPGSHLWKIFVARYVGGVAAASVPAGWTKTFGVPLPPRPTPAPAGFSRVAPDAALKVDAALLATAMDWMDYLEWGVKLSLLAVPIAGEEIALIEGADILGVLIGSGMDRIANDPPSRHFRSLARPRNFEAPSIQPGGRVSLSIARVFNRYARAGVRVASLEGAYITSVERAEGAKLDHKHHWYVRQAGAARDFLAKLSVALRRFQRRSARLGRRLEGTRLGRIDMTSTQIMRAHRALQRRSLPRSVKRHLRRIGMTRTQIRRAVRFALKHPVPYRLPFRSLLSSKVMRKILRGAARDGQAQSICKV